MEVDPYGHRRYELKFAVTESLARAIRDHIQPIFSLDKHASSEQGGYIVNNVYLDTPSLQFYYDTMFKKETRFKPRVRYYGRQPEDFLVVEVKHRHNAITWKRRRRIPVDEWPSVLDVSRSERTAPSFIDLPETFEEVNHLYSTVPVLRVRYFREPYVCDIGEYGRVTFDRALRYQLAHGSYEINSHDDDMTYYDDPVTAKWEDSPVVLEIKTPVYVPVWAIDLIRRFSLVHRGYSKYCYAIDQFLENGYNSTELAV
jgi:hypothetical protein